MAGGLYLSIIKLYDRGVFSGFVGHLQIRKRRKNGVFFSSSTCRRPGKRREERSLQPMGGEGKVLYFFFLDFLDFFLS